MPLVAMDPGATAFTRTPRCTHSSAAVCVRLIMPARAAPVWPMLGMPKSTQATTLTMAPPCASIHCV